MNLEIHRLQIRRNLSSSELDFGRTFYSSPFCLLPCSSNHLSTFSRTNTPTTTAMPSALPSPASKITKFTNCRLLKGEFLVTQDLWVSSSTGKIIHSQEAFYSQLCVPDETIDLGGRIISPGFIDVQLNGAFGFDFSSIPETGDPNSYGKQFRQANRLLVKTGVTSYLPTITSSRPEVYHHVSTIYGLRH